jgi:hypothetical protein
MPSYSRLRRASAAHCASTPAKLFAPASPGRFGSWGFDFAPGGLFPLHAFGLMLHGHICFICVCLAERQDPWDAGGLAAEHRYLQLRVCGPLPYFHRECRVASLCVWSSTSATAACLWPPVPGLLVFGLTRACQCQPHLVDKEMMRSQERIT